MIGFTAKISRYLLRAVNYIPLNQEIVRDIKRLCPTWKPLGEIIEPGTLRRSNRFARVDCDPEFGIRLVGQREGFSIRPEGRFISEIHLPNDPLIRVPEGTIVVASQGGLGETDSFARAQFITGKQLKYVYSEHFLRIIADETKILRGSLYAFIRSNISFRMLRGCAVGSIQQDMHPDILAEIPVPILKDNKSVAIDELIRNAYQKYDQAIDLEDEARTLVERAIEEGGR
jgi:type I restriction enzyme S subunit